MMPIIRACGYADSMSNKPDKIENRRSNFWV